MEKQKQNQARVVIVNKGKLLGFHAEDPQSKIKYFFTPGGEVKAGESFEEVAVRETLKGTGYKVSLIDGAVITRRYEFEWDGIVYDCTTQFLGGRLVDEKAAPAGEATYQRSVEWIAVDDVPTFFKYNKNIQEAVRVISTSTNFKP